MGPSSPEPTPSPKPSICPANAVLPPITAIDEMSNSDAIVRAKESGAFPFMLIGTPPNYQVLHIFPGIAILALRPGSVYSCWAVEAHLFILNAPIPREFPVEIQTLPAVADRSPALAPSGLRLQHANDHPPAVAARLGEEVVHGAARFFRRVNHAPLDAVAQGLRREVHEDRFFGLVHHPIRHGFPHPHAGDAPNLVVEALQVLHIHGGEDVDAGIQQRAHVLPAFFAARAGHVGMGELIDQGHGGLAAQDRLGIHLLELRAAVGNGTARDGFQALGLGDGVAAAVRLEVGDDDVRSPGAERLRLVEHTVGLADPGGVAEVDLSSLGSWWRFQSIGAPTHPSRPRQAYAIITKCASSVVLRSIRKSWAESRASAACACPSA